MFVQSLSKPFVMLALLMTLTACLRPQVGLETISEVYVQLGSTLPTASRSDTTRTRQEIATHRAVYFATCREIVPDICATVVEPPL